VKLAVRGLSKRLSTRPVLRDIDLDGGDGELIAIVGENGSGKSTLLRLLAGIFEPDQGQIQIDGHEVRGGGTLARQQLAYVPDASEPLPDLTLREFLALVAALKGAALPDPALHSRLHLDALGDQRLGSMSFGQRKRACLLSAFIGDPWLWLLDEPTNGIDPEGVALIQALLAERKETRRATILATNDQPFVTALAADLAARVLRLRDGTLFEPKAETHGHRP